MTALADRHPGDPRAGRARVAVLALLAARVGTLAATLARRPEAGARGGREPRCDRPQRLPCRRPSKRCKSTWATWSCAWTSAWTQSSWRSPAPSPTTHLMRYDAYNELSGQQSVSIALLDDRQSGVVLTCIHHRDQARVYAKQIRDGIGELELSPEEAEAVRVALAEEPSGATRGPASAPASDDDVSSRLAPYRGRAIWGQRAPSARRRCWRACRPPPSSRSRWRRSETRSWPSRRARWTGH